MSLPKAPIRCQVVSESGQEIYEWEQTLEDVLIYIHPPKEITAKKLNVQIKPTHLLVGQKGAPPFLDVCPLLVLLYLVLVLFSWFCLNFACLWKEELAGVVREDASLWTLGLWLCPCGNFQIMHLFSVFLSRWRRSWNHTRQSNLWWSVEWCMQKSFPAIQPAWERSAQSTDALGEVFQRSMCFACSALAACSAFLIVWLLVLLICFCIFVQHPGFDFSSASFSGIAPDASSFMGGPNVGQLRRSSWCRLCV